MPNPHEEFARALKVSAIVMVIDDVLYKTDRDPYKAASIVANLTDEQWRRIAVLAGKRPPSEVTKAAVVGVYQEREKQAEEFEVIA